MRLSRAITESLEMPKHLSPDVLGTAVGRIPTAASRPLR
jgi:hypothetical protein